MKELSIEQKAKRYDEALKVASKYKDIHIMFSSIQNEMFPELKESEDERIRKMIIKTLNRDKILTEDEAYDCFTWLKKQGEQKPIDKIEPKFKKGDWVIDKQGIVHQIANVIEIVTNNIYGYDIVGGGYFNDNIEGVRLWTIQDANDGDVLAVDNVIFMYKRVLASHIVSYCKLINDVFESTSDARTCCEGNTYVHPATKKQRDALMKAMADAGYTFDFEKKELKKLKE